MDLNIKLHNQYALKSSKIVTEWKFDQQNEYPMVKFKMTNRFKNIKRGTKMRMTYSEQTAEKKKDVCFGKWSVSVLCPTKPAQLHIRGSPKWFNYSRMQPVKMMTSWKFTSVSLAQLNKTKL